MIGKNRIKQIRQFAQKKHRDAEGLFLAEGAKVLHELLPLLSCKLLCATEAFLDTCEDQLLRRVEEIVVINQRELEQMSQLKTPRHGLALFHMPPAVETKTLTAATEQQMVLALDGVQDPGNLGTIVRIADWWGIDTWCARTTLPMCLPQSGASHDGRDSPRESVVCGFAPMARKPAQRGGCVRHFLRWRQHLCGSPAPLWHFGHG